MSDGLVHLYYMTSSPGRHHGAFLEKSDLKTIIWNRIELAIRLFNLSSTFAKGV